jgi:hypothetical protein
MTFLHRHVAPLLVVPSLSVRRQAALLVACLLQEQQPQNAPSLFPFSNGALTEGLEAAVSYQLPITNYQLLITNYYSPNSNGALTEGLEAAARRRPLSLVARREPTFLIWQAGAHHPPNGSMPRVAS